MFLYYLLFSIERGCTLNNKIESTDEAWESGLLDTDEYHTKPAPQDLEAGINASMKLPSKFLVDVRIGDEVEIDGLVFVCIGYACPEQYDVYPFDSKDICGYVKIRWGKVRCDYPDAGGETIYQKQIGEDNLQGCFDSHEERMFYLNAIAKAIKQKMERD